MAAIGLWQNYVDLRHVREQNQDLQKTIDRLRLEQASLLEDAHQGERLQALLDFQHRYIYTTLAAQAIGSSGSDQSRVFYLDKGSNNGLKPDMAVITADGIVGKVRDVFPSTAQVLAINDQTSGAGVILETTRIRGILTGNAAGRLEVVRISADERIKPGEKVLTAGGDLVFPRGLPVGEVEKVVPDPDRDGLIQVIVKPAAHLDRLDEVLVITNTQPRFSPEEQQDLTTSETLAGAEAAAIKDQLKASQIMAERLPSLIVPNLPPEQQPLFDTSNPNSVAHPPQALHPDRFTPGADGGTVPAAQDTPKQGGTEKPKTSKPPTTAPKKAGPAAAKPETAKPERNP
jgi:rod shape-determining protein MreC